MSSQRNLTEDAIALELTPRPPTMQGFPAEDLAWFILTTGWTGSITARFNTPPAGGVIQLGDNT